MNVILGSETSPGKRRTGLDSFSTRNHVIVTAACRISVMRTPQSWCGSNRDCAVCSFVSDAQTQHVSSVGKASDISQSVDPTPVTLHTASHQSPAVIRLPVGKQENGSAVLSQACVSLALLIRQTKQLDALCDKTLRHVEWLHA
jgi:hypothetical protein